MCMNDLTDFYDGFFKHTMRRRVGYHESCKRCAVGFCFYFQIRYIHVPLIITGYGYNGVATHGRTGRIGAEGAGRNEAHVAMPFTPRLMVGPNHEEARVLTLGAGIRLQRDAREARDLGERVLELREELRVALRLVGGGKRVDAAQLGPCHGNHLRGGVEFHGAGSQGDHAVAE